MTIENESIEALVETIELLEKSKCKLKNQIENINNTINITRNKLLKKCPHKNTVREREPGMYGDVFWFCKDCKQYI